MNKKALPIPHPGQETPNKFLKRHMENLCSEKGGRHIDSTNTAERIINPYIFSILI
jgi:hypothetical protein